MSVGSIPSSPATLANFRALNAAQVASSGATIGGTNDRIAAGKPVASQPSDNYSISPSALGPGLATVSLNSILQLQSSTGTRSSYGDDFASRQLIASNAMADAKRSVINYLADADMAKEGAQKRALQTRQQLGTQALSIANQAPQSLISLFSA